MFEKPKQRSKKVPLPTTELDIMPVKKWPLPSPLSKLVLEYAIDNAWVCNKALLFSGHDYALQRILFLAETAGPVAEFDILVRQLIQKEIDANARRHVLIDHIFIIGQARGSLIQCLIITLELSIKNKRWEFPGMANCFLAIVEELLGHKPQVLQAVYDQIKIAAPVETEEAQAHREARNAQAIDSLFTALQFEDGPMLQQGIQAFEAYIKGTVGLSLSTSYFTNSLYYMNLVHLVYLAFDRLNSPEGTQIFGAHYGKNAILLCFDIIGAQLQSRLPTFAVKILENGVEKLSTAFESTKVDKNVSLQIRDNSLNPDLERGFYFNEEGLVSDRGLSLKKDELYGVYAAYASYHFENYYKQLYKSLTPFQTLSERPKLPQQSLSCCSLM